MPVSTFFGIQTSLSGILAHQRSLDVTGHNVANASTQGYSRQEAVLGGAPSMFVPAGARLDGSGAQLGAGVGVSDFRRIRDEFLDVQYRAQSTVLGEADTKARSLEGLDLALAEPSATGLAAQLGKLWSAFSNVANDPSSVAGRQALVEQAKTVANAFGQLDTQLLTLRDQAAAEMTSLTSSPNGTVAQIAAQLETLGVAIRNSYTAGQKPNDLLDARDQLIDQLSALGTTTVVDRGGGAVRVLFGGTGTPLVDDELADGLRVNWPQTLVDPGGRIGALNDLSKPDGILDSFRDELATVAGTVAARVNEIHRQGNDPIDFFGFDATVGASSLSVLVTAASVQLGRPPNATDPATAGANDLAREMAALRGGEADQLSNRLVTRAGAEVAQNERVRANAQVLTNAVQDRRDSASGVSLDEEMTNLIRFQRGYQASARTMSTLDEMLDVLINRTGRVGL